MRWSYLIPRLVIVALIWAFVTFGLDPSLKYAAKESLQAVTGAKADIGAFETGFFPPRISVRSVALADKDKPGTNLAEFDKMSLLLAGAPLLRKSYVVEEAEITGVRFGTFRNDDGQLEIEPGSDEPTIPPWVTDKLKNIGDEWIDSLTDQVKNQLDPNSLESYTVGTALYEKWDGRFHQMNTTIKTAKAELDSLKQQMDAAKEGNTVDQIQNYLQLAQRADLLLRNSRGIADQFRTSVPLEVRQDFQLLDQAQKNDRARVGQTIRMLKPDPRRITESLIGEEMYLQLQHMLSWVETIRGYQHELKQPPAPERYRGRDFEFAIFNPTPKVLCRRMLLNGELMLSDVPTPFEAVVNNITSDPKLLGQPAVLQASTGGEMPVRLLVEHNATQEISTTKLAADFTDQKVQQLSAGKAGSNQLTANLSNMHWIANVVVVEDRIEGEVSVHSDFGNTEVRTAHKAAATLAGLTQHTLAGVTEVNAKMTLSGQIKRPQVSVTSDLGDQISAGFKTAFDSYLPQMKGELLAMLDGYVDEQKKELSAKLGGRYTGLLADHKQLMDGIAQAKQIAMDLRSGRANPNSIYKAVSQTGVLSDKDQGKVDSTMGKANKIFNGMQDPNKALLDALPRLKKKLFR